MTNIYAVLLAAGSGSRFISTERQPKQFIQYKNKPLYFHSLETFRKIPYIQGIVIVFPSLFFSQNTCLTQEQEDFFSRECTRIHAYAQEYGLPCAIIGGGESRSESVYNALLSLPNNCSHLFIHDTARPFVSATLINSLYTYLKENPSVSGVIPALPLKDTIKIVNNTSVSSTLKREELVCVQTPQYFRFMDIYTSILSQKDNLHIFTDDSSFLESLCYRVDIIEGEEKNTKITTPYDSLLLQEIKKMKYKTTMGYDVHAYNGTRPCILGGIHIESPYKIKAHSDGDVVLHAIIDALLALTKEGDIGTCFPDTNLAYEGISSTLLLHEVLQKININNIELQHIDITIVAQEPKLQSYMKKIHTNLAYLLDIEESNISLKATTEEHLGFTGKKEGIKAYAIVSAIILE